MINYRSIFIIAAGFIFGASALTASAQLRAITAPQGGTGISTAIAGDVGKCLTVLSNNPFTYQLGACGSGGGVGTSTNPFMASYFVATSTRATSTFAGDILSSGIYAHSGLIPDLGTGHMTPFTLSETLYNGTPVSWIDSGHSNSSDDVSGYSFYGLDDLSGFGSKVKIAEFTGYGDVNVNRLLRVGDDSGVWTSNSNNISFGGLKLGFERSEANFDDDAQLVIKPQLSNSSGIVPPNIVDFIGVGNVQRGVFTGQGKLGIGTTTPFALLSVSSTTQSNGLLPLLSVASTTNAAIFTVLGNGNVGIGTSTPSARLAITANNILGNNRILALATPGNVERFTFLSSGKFGINTTAPSTELEVNGDISLSNGADHTIKAADAPTTSGSGRRLFVAGGLGNLSASPSAGGALVLTGGSAGIDDVGGSVYVAGGNSAGDEGDLPAANVYVYGGTPSASGIYGNVILANNGVSSFGNVGVATSSPGTLLSIGNTGNNTINISPTATSTFGSGLNIRTGCYAINGTCVGGSAFVNTLANGGTATTTFYNGGVVFSDVSTLTQSAATKNLFWDETNKRLGIGTSTPWGQLSVDPNNITGPALVVGSSTVTKFIVSNSGNVGVGITNPTTPFYVYNPITTAGNFTTATFQNTGSNFGATILAEGGLNPSIQLSDIDNTGAIGKLQIAGSQGVVFGSQTNNPLTVIVNNTNRHIYDTTPGSDNGGQRMYGHIRVGDITAFATLNEQLLIVPTITTTKVLVARGMASQTGSLQEWQDSSSNVLASVNSNGMISGSLDTMTYTGTITLDVTKPNVHMTTTVNATGNSTINASGTQVAGQEMVVIINNDATSGKVITFGTGFKTTGTITGTASKTATIRFVSDGTTLFETSRTLAL